MITAKRTMVSILVVAALVLFPVPFYGQGQSGGATNQMYVFNSGNATYLCSDECADAHMEAGRDYHSERQSQQPWR